MRVPNGEILSAWFGGTTEGAEDVAIWCSRRDNSVWLPPIKVVEDEGVPNWNPILFTKEDGNIMLFYKAGHKIKEWYTKFIVSMNNGYTWTNPLELVPEDRGGRGPVRNKIIVLSDGTWLAPASTEDGIWNAFADRSCDGGKTWVKSEEIYIKGLNVKDLTPVKSNIPVSEQSFAGRGIIQPTLWESQPGIVHMLLRSTEGKVYRSDSSDFGKTWSDAYPTPLPNNNSGIDVTRLNNGVLVLAYNPVGTNWGPRTPMALCASVDNGISWSEAFILDDGPGEYSYPAIVSNGMDIFLTYTWKRERIVFWKICYAS